MGSDIIRLTGLRVEGRHGVFESERTTAQPFVIDADLYIDLATAGHSDELSDTVSYAEVASGVEQVVTTESFNLIERLASVCVERVLHLDERIQAATITVHKPQAPMPQTFEDVAVSVHRRREDLAEPADPAELETARAEIAGVYEGELVDEDASASSDQEAGHPDATYTTPGAKLGPYDRVSLADLEPSHEAQATHTRDPDLAAAFPVRSVLALGSNLGNSQEILTSAITALEEHTQVSVVNTSPVARTKPVGGPANQRDFLNQVVEVQTQLSPHGLLDLVQQIEADHNRVRDQKWGPRTLDVDIVTYAQAHIDSPRLQVPHPAAAERAFVLTPWSWMDPVALLEGRPVRELATEADDAAEVFPVDPASAGGQNEGANPSNEGPPQ